ncbi:MAG: TolC family protein [Pseudomonadales bacterium]|jgi:outer membrane protein TolC|nr:TolC family protein [Pseudomonadales bacterium]
MIATRRRSKRIVAVLLFLLAGMDARSAEDRGTALVLAEVLSSSIAAVPKILETREKRRAEEARLLSAQGAFDRSIEQSGLGWANGYYDGRQLDSRFVQPLRSLGADLYAGYRISGGDFPVYQDQLVTLDRGEFNAGLSLPLLRDRAFDERRFKLRDGQLKIDLADADLLLAKMSVQHGAMRAYWSWVTAGRRLQVLERLLIIAEERDIAFREQFAQGDIAEISVVENYQNVLKRRQLARSARRDFEIAAVDLSLYLRDEGGRPLLPLASRLPDGYPPVTDATIADAEADLRRALTRQPELVMLDREMDRERNRLRLAENDLRPEVDLGLKMARDLGDGSETRNGTDVIAELKVSVPVERRKARGEIGAAEAELRSLVFGRQRIQERLQLQVARLVEAVDAAVEFTRLARQEADQAQVLEDAEWTRFREGASSFFLLNVREENTADARVRALDATLGYFQAMADYYLATADFDALAIGPELLPSSEPELWPPR